MVRLTNENITTWRQIVLVSPSADDLNERATGAESDDVSTHSQTSMSQSVSDDQTCGVLPDSTRYTVSTNDRYTVSTRASSVIMNSVSHKRFRSNDKIQSNETCSAEEQEPLSMRTPSTPPTTPSTASLLNRVTTTTAATFGVEDERTEHNSSSASLSLKNLTPISSSTTLSSERRNDTEANERCTRRTTFGSPRMTVSSTRKSKSIGAIITPWAHIYASIKHDRRHSARATRMQPWTDIYARLKLDGTGAKLRAAAQEELAQMAKEEEQLSMKIKESESSKIAGSREDVIRYSRARMMEFRTKCAYPCPKTIPPQIHIDAEPPAPLNNFQRGSSYSFSQRSDSFYADGSRKSKRAGRKMDHARTGSFRENSGSPRQAEKEDEWRTVSLSPPSASSWQAQCRTKSDEDPEKVFVRRMKAIMNKLTIEKFDTLYAQLLECGFTKKEHIQALMKEVFDKATTQHHFIEMYTTLCMKINDWLEAQHGIDDDEKCFKRILLNQCQESFQANLQQPEYDDNQTPEERFEQRCAYKTRMLGNMKLVAHLLINKMLSSKVIFEVTAEMIRLKSDETLETLSVFLSCIGPVFGVKEWGRYADFDKVMQKVEKLSVSKKITPRIQCLLKDVLDQRDRDWVQKTTTVGPTNLAKIREQWVQDNEDAQRKRYQPRI